MVEVSDRGPGFAPGDEQRAFEKFYRGRSAACAGSGSVWRSAGPSSRSTAARITAENRSGGGATIRFTLPLEGSPRGRGLSDG